MTTRSTTYAKAAAGQLEIIFSGDFSASLTGDAGFPQSGGADITMECIVSNSGGELARTYIERASPSAHLLLNYPGGSVSWTAAMSDVSHSFGGGLGSIGVTPKVTFILIKK
jgi:hypothetical protein